MSHHTVDDFNGNDGLLIQCIDSLLEMDAKGILVPHGIGGHARTLLKASKAALEQAAQAEQSAELDALLNAARALDAMLDRDLHVLDKEVVFPFESHTQAWNHIVDARQIASEAAAIAKERQS